MNPPTPTTSPRPEDASSPQPRDEAPETTAPSPRTPRKHPLLAPLRKTLLILVLLLLAAALHALLFLGVRIPSEADSKPATKQPAQSILLPDSTQPRDMPDQLRLLTRIFDPTILTKPHPQHGFSSFLERPRPTPTTAPPTLPTLTDLTAEHFIQVPPLPPSQLALAARIQSIWPPPASVPLRVPPPQKIPQSLLWRTAAGTPIAGMPSIAPEDIRKLADTARPEHPTRIRIERFGTSLRIRRIQTCGIPALDQRAIRELRKTLQPVLIAPENPPENAANIPGTLLPQPDNPVEIEAEWRPLLTQAVEENTP